MKMLILAAGYATRLYPLTKDFPKLLLEVQGKTIIDHMLVNMDCNKIEQIVVVTNHRFVTHFEAWKAESAWKDKLVILDDGSIENENRLGAVKDIVFAVESLNIADDLFVVAGDNLLDFSLDQFVKYYEEKKASVVMRHYEEELVKLQRTGVASVNENDEVVLMEEKPKQPKSNWAVPPFYVFRKEDLHLLNRGLREGCSYDAPGDFIAWLCQNAEVYAMLMPGSRYDIGSLESYEKVKSYGLQGVQIS